MSIIYEPSGAAREYSPYACNLYIGCSHGCQYCYAPRVLQRRNEDFFGTPSPRRDVLRLLEKDLKAKTYDKQIMLSFIGDLYCDTADGGKTSRAALEILNAYKAPVAVLSKGGEKMLRDVDVFQAFGGRIAVGTTLTFMDEDKSRQWEPGATLPKERLEALKELKNAGIKTFVSFEPVLEISESLKLIERTLHDDSVVYYKIGKLNNFRGLDKGMDWQGFLRNALEMIRPAKKELYIKKSLRELAPDIELFADETDHERYIVRAT
ncbi:MAG: hypothetical protein FWB74_01280 [Defluviitaleaceae bacterium]|nr:hypothetical protein [Defluviitaleaceae bacterium]